MDETKTIEQVIQDIEENVEAHSDKEDKEFNYVETSPVIGCGGLGGEPSPYTAGLSMLDGCFYMYNRERNQLYMINRTTGMANRVRIVDDAEEGGPSGLESLNLGLPYPLNETQRGDGNEEEDDDDVTSSFSGYETEGNLPDVRAHTAAEINEQFESALTRRTEMETLMPRSDGMSSAVLAGRQEQSFYSALLEHRRIAVGITYHTMHNDETQRETDENEE